MPISAYDNNNSSDNNYHQNYSNNKSKSSTDITSASTSSSTTTTTSKNGIHETSASKRTSWNLKSTYFAKNTHNRIRQIVEKLKITPNPQKPMIPLSIGDPTTFGNLKASDETMKAVMKSIASGKYNGYAHSQGHEEARRAIAKYSAHQSPNGEISIDNIIICSGCSSALEYCLLSLAEAGQNILLPRPGFCIYQTHCEGLGVEVRYYDLLPERDWEADLDQLESLIDENTAALVINNPSNPCGSVFSKEHLQEFIKICEKYYLPIIADEIYEHFVFPGYKYLAISSLTNSVPVLTCSGLTKRFLVPGWRFGWIIIHDRAGHLGDIKTAILNMSSRILGSNTIVQGAVPDILEKTPQSYFDGVVDVLFENAKLAYNILNKVRGLKPIMPSGAMYMMIGIDNERFPEFKDDTHFVQELVKEQSVFCLPGVCFEYPNYIRIVLTVPAAMIEEACSRIAEFCNLHYKHDNSIIENGNLLEAVAVEF